MPSHSISLLPLRLLDNSLDNEGKILTLQEQDVIRIVARICRMVNMFGKEAGSTLFKVLAIFSGMSATFFLLSVYILCHKSNWVGRGRGMGEDWAQ